MQSHVCVCLCRFFIISADGSGTELLRVKDVHKYMAEACSDPATAVLQDPVQEQTGRKIVFSDRLLIERIAKFQNSYLGRKCFYPCK